MTSSREPRYRHGWSDGHAIGKIDGRKELIDESRNQGTGTAGVTGTLSAR